MARNTIDFGIDLGTTNSAIAVFNGNRADVFKGADQTDVTPSVVSINERGDLWVGSRAKNLAERDPDNGKIEFKREMHRDEPLTFTATGRRMTPSELSAEILKELKRNVNGEEVRAAVISIPAGFQGSAVEATKRAALLAGLEQCPMLSEPACAAIAYGFDKQSGAAHTRWMVYDFGGGTFDAALVRNHGGGINVEYAEGDNFLGGKDIDYGIVDTLLAPEFARRHGLSDFRRDNKKWRSVFAELKGAAETAKIRLSRLKSDYIDLRHVSLGDGRLVEFDFELTQDHIREIADPLVARSISICKAVLKRKNLRAGDIEKLVLVGGPTLMPCLRERLEDRSAGLGIPLEFRIDPFTVVAQGAAIYAAGQPFEQKGPPPASGKYALKLKAKRAGPEVEPAVDGQVVAGKAGEDLSRHTLEFSNPDSRPPWRGPKVPLTKDGKFLTMVLAERNRENVFHITLLDGQGTRWPLEDGAGTFLYTVIAADLEAQPLVNDICIGLADNTVITLFKRGAPLPVKEKRTLRTSMPIRKGGASLKVPILEGDQPRADRNRHYGQVEITSSDFQADLPEGSEVVLDIEIDTSRVCSATLYIVPLQKTYEITVVGKPPPVKLETVAGKVSQEKERLTHTRVQVAAASDKRAEELLAEIEDERLVQAIDDAQRNAGADAQSADEYTERLTRLQIKLDEIEDRLQWPAMVEEGEDKIQAMTEAVRDKGKAEHRTRLPEMVQAIKRAIESRDAKLLRYAIDQGTVFILSLIDKTELIVGLFYSLAGQVDRMKDRGAAQRAVQAGHSAIQRGDVPGLQNAVGQLFDLLPEGERKGFDPSTVLGAN